MQIRFASFAVAVAAAAVVFVGCGEGSSATKTRTLTIGAYTTPREVYAELLPAFAREWKAKTGEELKVEESYLGSGAQARAIVNGFEADVAALSLEPDVEKLRAAGLVTTSSKIASRSSVVIGVRPGNPKNVRGFADLARGDVDVLTPDVKMSGGAMWNVAAIVGSAASAAEGEALLSSVLSRVKVFDKGARESMLTFESGAGDAIVTYENEVVEAKRAGKPIEEVAPAPTVVIENPIVVVDAYAKKHGNADVAAAFVEFVTSPAAQAVFAAHGYTAPPAVAKAFTIADVGGWKKLNDDVFANGAAYDRALKKARP